MAWNYYEAIRASNESAEIARMYWLDPDDYDEEEEEEREFLAYSVTGEEIYEDDDYWQYEGRYILDKESDDYDDLELFFFDRALTDEESEAFWTGDHMKMMIGDLLDEVIKMKEEK